MHLNRKFIMYSKQLFKAHQTPYGQQFCTNKKFIALHAVPTPVCQSTQGSSFYIILEPSLKHHFRLFAVQYLIIFYHKKLHNKFKISLNVINIENINI